MTVKTHKSVPLRAATDEVCRVIGNSDGFFQERMERNLGWLVPEELEGLRRVKIGMAGTGGIGGLAAERFTRLGIGALNLADPDTFSPSNSNRQYGCAKSTIGRLKILVVGTRLRDINPELELRLYPAGITPETCEDFVDGCGLIVDTIDFLNLGARLDLHQRARERGIPVFSSLSVGAGARIFYFGPKERSLSEMLGMGAEEGYVLDEQVKPGQTATQGTKAAKVRETYMNLFADNLPEYYHGNLAYAFERFNQGSIPVIPATPMLAACLVFYASLQWLLERMEVNKRNMRPLPKAPDYIGYDPWS